MMGISNRSSCDQTGVPRRARKPYQRPALVHYGALAELTAGGSGRSSESCGPDNSDSGCNPDENKRKPF